MVTGGAAVIAVLLSFFPKFGALIQTIPSPRPRQDFNASLRHHSASSGLRTLVDSGVDYQDKRNLTISSVILVIGSGEDPLIAMGRDLMFTLEVALATVVSIFLNLDSSQEREA